MGQAKGDQHSAYLDNWVVQKLRWYLFFDWIKKIKIFDFFYSTKNNMLISINIIKVNFLLISSV